jgi:hypothetical protein
LTGELWQETILESVLSFIYTIGHWIGTKIVEIIQYFSGISLGQEIVDAVGMLAILDYIPGNSRSSKKGDVDNCSCGLGY